MRATRWTALAAGLLGTVLVGPAGAVSIDVGTAEGHPGSTVTLEVALSGVGEFNVVGVENTMTFAPGILVAAADDGFPDCRLGSALERHKDSVSAYDPQNCKRSRCTGARVLVFPDIGNQLEAQDPILDGPVYTCVIAIDDDVDPGTYPVTCTNPIIPDRDPQEEPNPDSNCTGGTIVVRPRPPRTVDEDFCASPSAKFAAVCNGGSGGCQVVAPQEARAAWVALLPALLGLLGGRRKAPFGKGGSERSERGIWAPKSPRRCAPSPFCRGGGSFGVALGAALLAALPAEAVTIRIGSATGPPGAIVEIPVMIDTMNEVVAETENVITFFLATPIRETPTGEPDCTVNPATQSDGVFAFEDDFKVRAQIFPAPEATEPFDDGVVLYTCRVAIPFTQGAGVFSLGCPEAIALDFAASPKPTTCAGGRVRISGAPLPTPTVTPTPRPGGGGGGGGGCQVSAPAVHHEGWLLVLAALALLVRRLRHRG